MTTHAEILDDLLRIFRLSYAGTRDHGEAESWAMNENCSTTIAWALLNIVAKLDDIAVNLEALQYITVKLADEPPREEV